jgi:putative inorganic carbon (hco3(-)) transporter
MASAAGAIKMDGTGVGRAPASSSPIAFWALVTFTYVLFVAPQLTYPILQQLGIAKLVMIVGILAHVAARLGRRAPILTGARETTLILALLAVGALSVIWSFWPGGSWDVLTNEFGKSVIVFLLLSEVIDTPRRLRILLGSMLLWGLLIADTMIRDYLAGNFMSFSRVFGFDSPLAANPNDAALLLDILSALGFGLFLAARNLVARGVLAVATMILVSAVMLTLSRGGFLGLVAMVGAIALHQRKRRTWMVALLVGVGCAWLVLAPAGYSARVTSIFDISEDETGSAQLRWESTLVSLHMMLGRPWGVGLGQNMLGLRALGAEMAWTLEFPALLERRGWTQVHNVFLQIGTELGFLGFAIFVVLVVTLMRNLRRSLRELGSVAGTEELRSLGVGVEVAIVVFLVGGLFAPVAYHFYFYYLAGLAVAVQRMARARTAGRTGRGESPSVRSVAVS